MPFSDTSKDQASSPTINKELTKSFISNIHAVIDQIDNGSPEPSSKNIDCKYYECQDFSTMACNNKPYFLSALHLNIASMSCHFDEFCTLLASLQHSFSFIGISESRFLKNNPTTFNFEIPGFSTEHTPTESSAGGALLYISNRFSYHLRADLNQCMYQAKSLESVFVEINFPKKQTLLLVQYIDIPVCLLKSSILIFLLHSFIMLAKKIRTF